MHYCIMRIEVKYLLIILLILSSGVVYYSATDNSQDSGIIKREVFVSRVIDGDTIQLNSQERIRLLGINTPEKNMPYHDEAMNFLAKAIEGKKIMLESFYGKDKDKYGRTLGYVILNDVLVNEQVLNSGFANLYVYDEDLHYQELKTAEETARQNEIGLWKKSPETSCLKLIELKWNEGAKRCTNNEQLVLENSCNKTLSVIIKDSANHIDKERLNPGIFTKNYSCVWNDAGDSLTVRDEQGLLLYYNYRESQY